MSKPTKHEMYDDEPTQREIDIANSGGVMWHKHKVAEALASYRMELARFTCQNKVSLTVIYERIAESIENYGYEVESEG